MIKNVFLLVISHLLSFLGWLSLSVISMTVVHSYYTWGMNSEVSLQFFVLFILSIVLVLFGKLTYSRIDQEKIAHYEVVYMKIRTQGINVLSISLVVFMGFVCITHIIRGNPIWWYLANLIVLVYGVILLIVTKRLKKIDSVFVSKYPNKKSTEDSLNEQNELVSEPAASQIIEMFSVLPEVKEKSNVQEQEVERSFAKTKLFCGHCGASIEVDKTNCPSCGYPY